MLLTCQVMCKLPEAPGTCDLRLTLYPADFVVSRIALQHVIGMKLNGLRHMLTACEWLQLYPCFCLW